MQIKWNEVTWYSRWAAVVVFLVAVPVLCFYIGVIYGHVNSQEVVSEIGVPVKTTPVLSTTTSQFATYSNDTYNFTFQYPSAWKIIESLDKKTVKVDSLLKVPFNDKRSYSAFNVSFSVIPKTSFQKIGTKVGEITYDVKKQALVDVDRCLPQMPLANVSGALPAFAYGGSMMSSPAHFEYAVLRNDDKMILIAESSDTPEKEIERKALAEGKDKMYSSFAFTKDIDAFVPPCAKTVVLQ